MRFVWLIPNLRVTTHLRATIPPCRRESRVAEPWSPAPARYSSNVAADCLPHIHSRGDPAARAIAHTDRPGDGGCRRFLQRQAPVRPRGAGRGPQAPRHVHRLDRRPGPAALPLGDLRQLGGRGARRLLHPDRGHPARRRVGRGARQRPRHPRRHRAEDQALRRRTRAHPAARGRQVRRRLLHRLRRPARRRRVRRQRALRPARHRGRPGRQDLDHELPARGGGRVRRTRPRRRLHQEVRAAPDREGPRDQDRHQDQVLAGPPGVPQGRHLQLRRPRGARPADRVPGAGPRHRRPRGRPGRPTEADGRRTSRASARPSSASTAASASSASTWRPARRSPRCSG